MRASDLCTLSDHVYRSLLIAYPATFRRRYGVEMAQVFRTCCRITYRSSGVGGIVKKWQRGCVKSGRMSKSLPQARWPVNRVARPITAAVRSASPRWATRLSPISRRRGIHMPRTLQITIDHQIKTKRLKRKENYYAQGLSRLLSCTGGTSAGNS